MGRSEVLEIQELLYQPFLKGSVKSSPTAAHTLNRVVFALVFVTDFGHLVVPQVKVEGSKSVIGCKDGFSLFFLAHQPFNYILDNMMNLHPESLDAVGGGQKVSSYNV